MPRNSVNVTTHSAGPRIGSSSSRFFSMRPSHLVIEGGQPPLLKITVWLGDKGADNIAWRLCLAALTLVKFPTGIDGICPEVSSHGLTAGGRRIRTPGPD